MNAPDLRSLNISFDRTANPGNIRSAGLRANAELKANAGKRFQVINVATGKPVGEGAAFEYGFAKYARDSLDMFGKQSYVLREVTTPARFPNVFCSECGRDFPESEHGFSMCRSHEGRVAK